MDKGRRENNGVPSMAVYGWFKACCKNRSAWRLDTTHPATKPHTHLLKDHERARAAGLVGRVRQHNGAVLVLGRRLVALQAGARG